MKRRHWTCILPASAFAFLFSMLCLPSYSQTATPQPASTLQDVLPEYIQEFFLSEAVRSQERGEVQLTVQASEFRDHRSSLDGGAAGLDFEYGITRRLQFGMELPYGVTSTDASELPISWSALDTSILYQPIRSNYPFALSVAMGVSMPLTSRAQTSYQPELLLAKQFGMLQIHTSLLPEFSADEHSLAYNVAAVKPIPHALRPTLEFSGRRNAGINTFYITPGLYQHLPHRLEVGCGLPVGIGSLSSPAGVVFKMTWEFGGDQD